MSIVNAVPLLEAAGGDYQISRSVRLRSSASAYFNRTPASAGNRKTWTLSWWMKRGALSAAMVPFQAGSTGSEFTIDWRGFDAFDFYEQTASVQSSGCTTNAVYRDPSAWYHIVFAYDTTQATSTNRWKLYINGTQVTSFSATQYPTLNYDGYVNSTVAHYIGIRSGSTTPFDGYLTEINFIDGQALTPSSFGETDAVTGVWKPKKYAGTYGTNGFYLNFSDNSAATAAAIGKDSSGNGNNWTPNNISVTSGSTYDSMLDVPTMWADGGNGRGNYAVLNPINLQGSVTSGTITEANLKSNPSSSAGYTNYLSSIAAPSTGYWYAEFTVSGTYQGANNNVVGIQAATSKSTTQIGGESFSYGYFDGDRTTGSFRNNGSTSQSVAGFQTGDTLMVAFGNGNLWFGKNGTWLGTGSPNPATATSPAYSSLSGDFYICYSSYGTSGVTYGYNSFANFGQRPFAYTPPTGFKALNTQNLPDATIKKGGSYFNALPYTGTGASRTQTGVGFQPDFTWVKRRDGVADHGLMDSVRGASQRLQSNLTAAEDPYGFTSFASDGFTFNGGIHNDSGWSFISWNWKKGATQGFDIVTYTGNGSAGNTFNHSLGVAPSMFIVKGRSGGSAATDYWYVYHKSLGNSNRVYLNATNASSSSANVCYPSGSSQIYLATGDSFFNASSENYVAYLFAEVAGFSKFGSYTGNGSTDGPFVYCGFRPKFVMWKKTTGVAADWDIYDSSRDAYNIESAVLYPNSSSAENTIAKVDFLSNGFKIRATNTDTNVSGETYIFAAFAESPFRNSLAR